jgi:hypothetical protein
MAVAQTCPQQVSGKGVTDISDGNPGPGSVEMRGMFDKGSPRSKAFSFGLSREHYKRVFVKENLQADPSVPGPGRYQIQSIVGHEGQNVTMKGRNFKDKCKRI